MDNLEYLKEVEKSIQKRYKKKLWRPFCKAINQYELVKPGDKIAVCISGGKDSMLMAKLFQELKRHNKFEFELVFMVMDPGYNQLNRQMIIDNSKKLNIPIQNIHHQNYLKHINTSFLKIFLNILLLLGSSIKIL